MENMLAEKSTINNLFSSLNSSLFSCVQVKITTFTNQQWEPASHHGNLIASNDNYLAYVLESKHGYVIRILQRGERQNRALLRDFTGAVVDLAFAHSKSNKLVAVDQAGNLYYYDLDIAKGDMTQMAK